MRRWAVHVIAPLAGGVLVYVVFRRADIRLFGWLHALHLDGVVAALRSVTAPLRARHALRAVAGSFPDGAWAYAFGAAMGLVWRGEENARGARAWLVAAAAVTAALELGQAARVVPGVFDPLDLIVMLAAFSLGCSRRDRAIRIIRDCSA